MSDKPAKHVLNDEPIDDEIATVLNAVPYPANKDAIVDAAREAGVSNDVINLFDGLPNKIESPVDNHLATRPDS